MINVEFLIKMKNDNIIQKKSFDFALKIIELYKELVIQKEFILSKQLLRSGTSIGANVEEALAGQSKKDFIAKMSLASKEARETKYCNIKNLKFKISWTIFLHTRFLKTPVGLK